MKRSVFAERRKRLVLVRPAKQVSDHRKAMESGPMPAFTFHLFSPT
jgi:hypothetical protein